MQATGPRASGSVVLSGVARRFSSRLVVQDFVVDLQPGSLAALVGPNGCGKTTLLRLMAGLLEPDDGSVLICGDRAGAGQTGFLPAGDRGLHFRLTGRQNLEFFARIFGVSSADVAQAVESAAGSVGALPTLDKRVGDCSTGQRRRLALAQAIVGRSPVLLLDEPFADLDDDGVALVQTLSDGWCAAGGVVVAAAPELRQAPTGSQIIDLRRSVAL